MSSFTTKRILLRNGERLSMLLHEGIPVHIAVLYLNRMRTCGLAANTIHQACEILALLHNDMESRQVDIWNTIGRGRFLSIPDLNRFVDTAQYGKEKHDPYPEPQIKRVINIKKLLLRHAHKVAARTPVCAATHAHRIRTARSYLEFISDYAKSTLPSEQAALLHEETQRGLDVLNAQIPRVRNRAKVGARIGLTKEQEKQLLQVIDPDSETNPWKSRFVQVRNRLIVIILMATGMRRGELLGLKVQDLIGQNAKIRILRRADDPEDSRKYQPNAKSADREIPLSPILFRALEAFIRQERRNIKAARSIPQIFTSDDGVALSLSSASQIFSDIRRACPQLPRNLTAHVLRHTWNDRFSEHADETGMDPVEEARARTEHQGWVANSPMAATYTKRHTERKGRAVALSVQQKLEESINGSK